MLWPTAVAAAIATSFLLSAGPVSAFGQLAPRQDGEQIDSKAPEMAYCLCGNPVDGTPDTDATEAVCHTHFPKSEIGSRQKASSVKPFVTCEDVGKKNFKAFGDYCIEGYGHKPPGNGIEGAVCCYVPAGGDLSKGYCDDFPPYKPPQGSM